MSKTLLVGFTAAFVAFSAIPAHAALDDQVAMARFSGVEELTQSGAAAVNFVEGRQILGDKTERVAPASLTLANEQVDRYYDGSVLLTFAMLVIAAAALVVAASSTRRPLDRVEPQFPRRESWRDEVMRMIEADLTNYDGLKPGAAR